MEKFVQQQNLRRFRDLLFRVTDEAQRAQIKCLIAEELAKDPVLKLRPPGEQRYG